jgi:hypothetical protein
MAKPEHNFSNLHAREEDAQGGKQFRLFSAQASAKQNASVRTNYEHLKFKIVLLWRKYTKKMHFCPT